MLRFLVPLLFVASVRSAPYYPVRHFSAASPAQIRFAYKNKFDNTGPGANAPEYAYKTYNNLDDALLAYVDDADTLLPQHEKTRAIANLYRQKESPRILPFLRHSYPKLDDTKYKVYNSDEAVNAVKGSYRWPSVLQDRRRLKEGPNYSIIDIKPHRYQYKPHPDVEFSIDLHDKETGDLKTAKELHDGSGTVHGYFTMLDTDGHHRTLHYQNNPAKGFKSSVLRVY